MSTLKRKHSEIEQDQDPANKKIKREETESESQSEGYYVVVTNLYYGENAENLLLMKKSIYDDLCPLIKLLNQSSCYEDFEPLRDDLKPLIQSSKWIEAFFAYRKKLDEQGELDEEEEREGEEYGKDAVELWFDVTDFLVKQKHVYQLKHGKQFTINVTIIGGQYMMFYE